MKTGSPMDLGGGEMKPVHSIRKPAAPSIVSTSVPAVGATLHVDDDEDVDPTAGGSGETVQSEWDSRPTPSPVCPEFDDERLPSWSREAGSDA
eukprot:5295724-Amphidinium_carterae.1